MKKVMFQFTNGKSREMDMLSNGRLRYQNKPVDIQVTNEGVILFISGHTFAVQSSPHTLPGIFYNWGEEVTGMLIGQNKWLINLRTDDYHILQRDGTFYVLPGNTFRSSGQGPSELFDSCFNSILGPGEIVAAKVWTKKRVYGTIWQGHGADALCDQTGTPVLFRYLH